MKSSRRKPGIIKLIAGILFTIFGFYGVGCDLEQYVFLNVIFYLAIVFGIAMIFVFCDEVIAYRKRASRKSKKLEVF